MPRLWKKEELQILLDAKNKKHIKVEGRSKKSIHRKLIELGLVEPKYKARKHNKHIIRYQLCSYCGDWWGIHRTNQRNTIRWSRLTVIFSSETKVWTEVSVILIIKKLTVKFILNLFLGSSLAYACRPFQNFQVGLAIFVGNPTKTILIMFIYN